MRRLAALTVSMEENLSKAYLEQIPAQYQGQTHAADVVVCVVISVNQEQIVPEDTPDPEPELQGRDETETEKD
jgi:hypothetical protein